MSIKRPNESVKSGNAGHVGDRFVHLGASYRMVYEDRNKILWNAFRWKRGPRTEH